MLTYGVRKSVSNPDQVDTIRVYSFKDENIAGTFSNNLYGENIVFENMMSLILLIEDCMNSISFPRPMASLRKLDTTSEFSLRSNVYRNTADILIPDIRRPSDWSDEPVVVFRLRIIFRTLSGWQGEAVNVKTDERFLFRSDLELIAFIVDEIKKAVNVQF